MKTHIDLFSGIGGFALAARWAGIKTVQFVEIDKFCQKVLAKNFSGVPIHDDIKSFTYSNRNGLQEPRPEQQTSGDRQFFQDRPFILTGGFPCQPFSCAGKRRGKEDDRYLWEEMLRVIKEFKPTWIIGENVAGINSMEFQDSISELEGETDIQENGKEDYTNVLDGICDSLEALDYEVQPIIIPACAVNAPHRRDRVWIVANRRCEHGERAEVNGKSNRQVSCEENASLLERPISNDEQGINTNTTSGGCFDRIEQTDCHAADTGNQGLQKCESDRGTNREIFKETSSGCSNNHNWNEPWIEVATRLCRVDARVSNRVDRLKSLGNAVVPQIPYLIMKAILEVESK